MTAVSSLDTSVSLIATGASFTEATLTVTLALLLRPLVFWLSRAT